MITEHRQPEDIMKYLLGMLSEDEAAGIEQRYFVDRNFFLQVRAAERRLVEDYLDGSLNRADRRQFQRHYLGAPALRKLVESIASEHAPKARYRFRPAFAMALAALIVVVGVVTYRSTRPTTPVHIAAAPDAPASIALVVFPGLHKDADSRLPSLPAPAIDTTIRLIATLPSRDESTYRPTLALINADGQTTPVWQGSALTGARSAQGLQIAVVVSSALLKAGDYFLELDSPDGVLQYRCPFRITRTADQ